MTPDERRQLATTAAACRTEITRLERLARLGPCDHPPTVSALDWCDQNWLDRWMRSQPGMIPAAIEAQERILERINRSLTQRKAKP